MRESGCTQDFWVPGKEQAKVGGGGTARIAWKSNLSNPVSCMGRVLKNGSALGWRMGLWVTLERLGGAF